MYHRDVATNTIELIPLSITSYGFCQSISKTYSSISIPGYTFVNSVVTDANGTGVTNTNNSRTVTVTRTMSDKRGYVRFMYNVSATLTISPTSWNPASAASSTNITITTNQSSWNASSNQTWLTVTKSGTKLTLNTTANTGSTSRTATVTVTAGTAPSKTVTVTQVASATSTHEYTSDNSKRKLHVSTTHVSSSGHLIYQGCGENNCNEINSMPLKNLNGNNIYFKYAVCITCQLSAGSNKYAYPLPYIALTGPGNAFRTTARPTHDGIDWYPVMEDALGIYKNYNGTPIYSIASGKVIDADYSSERGYYVVIRHDFNPNQSSIQYSYSVYQHMYGASNCSTNNSVSIGSTVGYVGNTGNVSGSRPPDYGSHLHFEIRESNNFYLDNSGSSTTGWRAATPYDPETIFS